MVSACPNFICHFFYESDTEGASFRIMFVCYVMCMFCNRIVFNLCAFELVKSPEVTLSGWLGYYPTINISLVLWCILPVVLLSTSPCIEFQLITYHYILLWLIFVELIVFYQTWTVLGDCHFKCPFFSSLQNERWRTEKAKVQELVQKAGVS